MRIKLITILFIIGLFASCKGQEVKKGDYLIKKLEKAENSRDMNEIKSIFEDNAVLYTTELMPIENKSGIVSIYEFIFSRNDVENVKYQVDSTHRNNNHYYEYGKVITKKKGKDKRSNNFKAIFKKQRNEYKIVELSFGDEDKLRKKLPHLLKPTGEFNIGQTTFFYDKNISGNGRLLSFQIWYPTNSNSNDKQPFRTEKVISSASNFLGIPIFATSYFSAIESNTILNAPSISNKIFPVLIYNHGYGGFTQVYQTIFEDLVSHGYIVVSIGHENESALLVKENGDVISNSPQNAFYSKRSPELNGNEIGRWQDIILNSNEYSDNHKAYEEMLKLTPLHNESTRLWQSDTKATIEKLKQINSTNKNLKGIFNFEEIGIFGHSLGGATAGQMCFGKTPIKAGINLDGFQFGDLYRNKLKVPFMFVSSNQERDRYLRALTFIENSEQDCYQVTIKGFSHDNFTDLKYIMEGDKEAMELQRALIKSFFNKYLKNKKENLNELEDEYKQIKFTASNISN